MRIPFSSVLVAALALAPAPASTNDPTDAEAVAKLVARLGSGKYAQREAAMRQLEALGEEALAALKRATVSTDPEVRRRAEQLIPTIRQRAEAARLLSARRHRLVWKDVPVLEAVRDLAAKTGFDIRIDDEGGPLARRKVTLDTGEATFWEALDRLCQTAGLSEEDNADLLGGPLRLTALRTRPLPTHLAGAVRLRALPADARPRTAPEAPASQGAPAETGFRLEVSPEPRMPWQGVVGLRVTRAVDERGQVLFQTAPYLAPSAAPGRPSVWDGATGQPIVDEPALQAVRVRLATAKQPSARLKEVHGILTVRLRAMQEMLAVADILKAAGRTVKGERGHIVKVLHVARVGATLEVRVQTTDTVGAVPFQVVRGRKGVLVMRKTGPDAPVVLTLHDAAGMVIKPLHSARTLTPNPHGVGLLVEFRQVYPLAPSQSGPLRFSCSGPKTTVVDIPFTLRDVPISAETLPPANPYLPSS